MARADLAGKLILETACRRSFYKGKKRTCRQWLRDEAKRCGVRRQVVDGVVHKCKMQRKRIIIVDVQEVRA
jgi:hypothetical protein